MESQSEARTSPREGRVDVRGLNKTYGEHVVLRETDLVVVAGELFTLLGPSGSGKTTLLNIIAGFTRQTAGTVYIDDERVDDLPVYRRNLGMVFQNYSLFPHMTVEENIAFPLELRKVPKAERSSRVAEALQMVQMQGSELKRPTQLSGGQQQRIAIARALVFRPSVLLMDEPMSALDRKLRGQLQIELRNLQRRLGITVIFVTHDQEEALTMSDRIAVLHEGRVDQVGAPREIYERPEGVFQAQFLGDSTTFHGVVTEARGDRVVVALGDGTNVVGRSVDVAPSQHATLNIRAERIRLRPADHSGDASIVGIIDDAIYVGSEIRYVVRLPFAERVIVSAANGRRDEDLAIGSSVFVDWDPDDLACFADQEKGKRQ